MGIVLVLLFGIALIVGPIAAEVTGHTLSSVSQIILMASGLAIAIFAGVLLIITKLYQKTKASESFVRTGMGGFKIIKDGGALVIPVIHKVVFITLRTLKFEVSRMGKHALLTRDKLRADIGAEFFVRVMPDEASIGNAARSFGEHMSPAEVEKLVLEKAVSALRTVAATKTLEELNSNRDDFMRDVMQIVSPDLKHNGLTLETATISTLDQTSTENLDQSNVFDAEGLETIARITQQKMTERNRLEREGEQARKHQDVETRKKVLSYEQDQAEAEARQSAEVAKIQADQQREAEEKRIEATRQVDLAKVQKEKTVQVAQQLQQQDVEVADRARQQAVAVAEQKKQEAETRARQDVEVAERAKQQAVADAERLVATAQTQKANAEAQREQASQQIKTVEIVEAAKRAKQQQVIDAEAKAEQRLIAEQKAADANAYTITRDAQARKEAADADAEAVRKKANAEKDARVALAEGDRAVQMVPVDVKAQEVSVDQKRVETVMIPELQAREQHGRVAQEFELDKARIQAEMQVRIETARAAAEVYKKVDIKAFSTLDDVSKMTGRMMSGLGVAELANGLIDGLENDTVMKSLYGLEATIGAVANKLGLSRKDMEAAAAGSPVVEDRTKKAPEQPKDGQ